VIFLTVHRRDLLDLVDRLLDLVPAVLAEVEREVDVGDLAVLGQQCRHVLALGLECRGAVGGEHAGVGDALDLGDLVGLLVDRRQVGLGEPSLAVVGDQGRDLVGVDLARELVGHPGRLSRGGDPGRLLVVLDVGELVVLDVGELAAEGTQHAGEHQHHDEDDPLGHGSGQLAGDLAVHG